MSRTKATSFLSNLSTVWAHSDKPPYTATFAHTIPGPAKNVVADCLWWPPIIPALDDLPTHARIARLNGLSSADSEDDLPSPLEKQDEDGFSMVDDPTKDRVEEEIQEPAVTVMLFIPGNPGLVQFYQTFLDTIHKAHPSLGILAHSHLGHAPRLKNVRGKAGAISRKSATLAVQVASAIEAYDAIVDEYRDVGGCKIVLCGHSVGSWVAMQVMKARPDAIDAAFLLFPTLSDIALTPSGRALRFILTLPAAYILTAISYLLFVLILPAPIILSLLNIFFSHWPLQQKYILRGFLRSPRAVFSSITMGRHEMLTLRSLHSPSSPNGGPSVADILKHEARRIWVYYGDGDQWVPEHSAKEVFTVLRENGGARSELEVAADLVKGSRFQSGSSRAKARRKWLDGVCGEVVFGSEVPHDFCINHDVIIGQLCAKWLADGGLVSPLS